MKGLVVGSGSIGKRHLQNLRMLGITQLAIVEPDRTRITEIDAQPNLTQFSNLQSGLDWQPDFAIIATPNHLHALQALALANRGVHLFVEKPLSHNADHLRELAGLVAQKKLITLVGCNMRFHPGPAKLKELLSLNSLGKILFARIQVGSYLPDWRPAQDYRNGYAAKEETGGGCILDCIHEIDLACWYLGGISHISCYAAHLSSLEIETEDVAALICRHTSGTISEIHLDYVQRTYQRDCQIVGETGSIFWDYAQLAVRCYDAATKNWTHHSQPEAWQVNDMYVAEMKHFLDCVCERKQTLLPIPDAVRLMQVVFAAKSSAKSGAQVSVEEVPA